MPFLKRTSRTSVTAVACSIALGLSVLASLSTARAQSAPDDFSAAVYTNDLTSGAVGFALLPDQRILVVNHQSGRVELLVDGVRRPEAVLVVDSLVASSEQGLLGIAIDPDYPDSNYIYLFHSKTDSVNQISRFTVEGDLDDPSSSVLSVPASSKKKLFAAPDSTRLHNGGTLRFGSDKTLYASFGDDGHANDVQSLSNLFGKIVRINRDGSIPPDNPTFPEASPDALPEVFAMGLRNPFRFALDPQTDELFIGDVGTNLYEELNIASGGENFGYPHYEGPAFFRDFVPLIPPPPTVAAYAYEQSSNARSAIALSIYRQRAFPDDDSFRDEYEGAYFFIDYFDTTLQYLLRSDTGVITTHAFGSGYSRLVDAAIAADGSLLLLSYSGVIYRIGFEGDPNVAVDGDIVEPSFVLHQNYPNPFGAAGTTVSYSLDRAADVQLSVYDLLGREVARLVDAQQVPGTHRVVFEASNLPAGVYVTQLEVDGLATTKKMTLAGR